MNEELEEQASLYVFGLLESAEAAAFERRLESDDEMRALVDKLDEAAAAIAHNAPTARASRRSCGRAFSARWARQIR